MHKLILLCCIVFFTKSMHGQISVDSLEKKLLVLEEKIFFAFVGKFSLSWNAFVERPRQRMERRIEYFYILQTKPKYTFRLVRMHNRGRTTEAA